MSRHNNQVSDDHPGLSAMEAAAIGFLVAARLTPILPVLSILIGIAVAVWLMDSNDPSSDEPSEQHQIPTPPDSRPSSRPRSSPSEPRPTRDNRLYGYGGYMHNADGSVHLTDNNQPMPSWLSTNWDWHSKHGTCQHGVGDPSCCAYCRE